VPVFSDLQAAITKPAHLDQGPGQQLARAFNEHARALHTKDIDVVTHWVPGHSGISGHDDADHQAHMAWELPGYTLCERIYTSAVNAARRISEGTTVAKVKFKADRRSKHYSYRLKCTAASKRPIPMTSVNSLAARFY